MRMYARHQRRLHSIQERVRMLRLQKIRDRRMLIGVMKPQTPEISLLLFTSRLKQGAAKS